MSFFRPFFNFFLLQTGLIVPFLIIFGTVYIVNPQRAADLWLNDFPVSTKVLFVYCCLSTLAIAVFLILAILSLVKKQSFNRVRLFVFIVLGIQTARIGMEILICILNIHALLFVLMGIVWSMSFMFCE